MSSQWARDKKRKEREERAEREQNPPPLRPEHQHAIDEYEYWLAEADKRFGEGAGVVIVSLISNWNRLAEFQ